MFTVVHEESQSNQYTPAGVGGTLLDEIAREGARAMLATALQAEPPAGGPQRPPPAPAGRDRGGCGAAWADLLRDGKRRPTTPTRRRPRPPNRRCHRHRVTSTPRNLNQGPPRLHRNLDATSTAIIDAYAARGKPGSGRNMASVFHRLRLTLFHAGRLNSHRRAPRRQPVSVTGWAVVAPGIDENARRYVAQVELSLRPATTKHI